MQMVTVGPGLQIPALVVNPEPVECAVGNREIARRVQRPAGGPAVDHIEHPAVAHRRDCLSRVVPQQPVHRLAHPFGEPAQRLARPEIVIEVARQIVRMGLGMALGSLRGRQTLELPEMPLAQLWQAFHLQVLTLRQHPRRFQRPHQVAAVDRTESMVRRIERHRQRLRPPGRVERDVGVPLDALLNIPVGLAMADEAETGTRGPGNMMHINCMRTDLYQIKI